MLSCNATNVRLQAIDSTLQPPSKSASDLSRDNQFHRFCVQTRVLAEQDEIGIFARIPFRLPVERSATIAL